MDKIVRLSLLRLALINLVEDAFGHDGEYNSRGLRHPWRIFILVSEHGA